MDNSTEDEAFTTEMLEVRAIMHPCDWADYKCFILVMNQDWVKSLFSILAAGIFIKDAFKLFWPIRLYMREESVSISEATDRILNALQSGCNCSSNTPKHKGNYRNLTEKLKKRKFEDTVESLEGKLAIAVSNENYERAQWLKDKIDKKLQQHYQKK